MKIPRNAGLSRKIRDFAEEIGWLAPAMVYHEISIVMANWNGESYLPKALATLLDSAKSLGKTWEIIVVDDASTDDSKSLINKEFPEVRLVEMPRNRGFAVASNRGAAEARGRILVMVNNDMAFPPDYIRRLTAPFFEPTQGLPPLFAVGAKTIEESSGLPNQLWMSAAWRRGGISAIWGDPGIRIPATFVQGGSAAYDRALFLRLGGFDPLFYPGYWEDFDLSYRACKAGWRVLYEPRAVAWHRGKGSMSRIMPNLELERTMERNRLWFNWLNLEDPRLLLRHSLAIPWICLRELVTKKETLGLIGLLWALRGIGKIGRARRQRRRNAPPRMRTDKELLRLHPWAGAAQIPEPVAVCGCHPIENNHR